MTGREVTVGGGVELRIGLEPQGRRRRRAPRQRAVGEGAGSRHGEAARSCRSRCCRSCSGVRARPAQPRRARDRARDEQGRTGQLGAGAARRAAPRQPPASTSRPGAFVARRPRDHRRRAHLSRRCGRGDAGDDRRALAAGAAIGNRRSKRSSAARSTAPPSRSPASVGPFATLLDRGTPYPVSLRARSAGRKAAVAFKMRRDDKVVALRTSMSPSGRATSRARSTSATPVRESTWTVNLTLDGARPRRSSRRRARPRRPRQAGGRRRRTPHSCSPTRRCPSTRCAARNANGEIAIDRLTLPGGRTLDRVRRAIHAARREARRAGGAGVERTAARSPGSVTIDATPRQAAGHRARARRPRSRSRGAARRRGREARGARRQDERRRSTSRCAATRRTNG